MTKTNEEILNLWNDQEACPDFKPVLDELLVERDRLRSALGKYANWANWDDGGKIKPFDHRLLELHGHYPETIGGKTAVEALDGRIK